MTVELVRITENPVDVMAHAGANCYQSESTAKLVEHCRKSGHTAIMEFADFHFHVEGVSRALLAQITRHRIGTSFSVQSQRYVNKANFEYITPPSVGNESFVVWDIQDPNQEPATFTYKDMMDTIQAFYQALIDAGVPKEDARYVLPNACDTVLDFKANLRSLMHFMNLRLCNRAQWEIRELAQKMRDCIIAQAPELASYLVPKCEIHAPYCFCTEEKSCGKHKTLKGVFESGSQI